MFPNIPVWVVTSQAKMLVGRLTAAVDTLRNNLAQLELMALLQLQLEVRNKVLNALNLASQT